MHTLRYVKQHVDILRLDPSWLSQTFSSVTFASSVLAIVAGVASNVGAEALDFGPRAPFALAVPCFAVCLVIVVFAWDENYGDQVCEMGTLLIPQVMLQCSIA